MITHPVVAIGAAWAISLFATGMLIPVLKRKRVLDVPNARSSHAVPTPRGGGVAVAGSLLVVTLCLTRPAGTEWAVLAFVGVCAVVGLLDDLHDLSVGVRLLILSGGAVSLSATLLRPEDPTVGLMVIAVALWLVGFVNAFNFMDGVNGMAALNATLAGLWYAWLGHQYDSPFLGVVGLALAGAALGFLPWNFPNAMVFLGDVGSYALGGMCAALALVAWNEGSSIIVAGCPLAIYCADTGYTLVRRIMTGQDWRRAHHGHVYQRLLDHGWGHVSASLLVVGAGVAVVSIVALSVLLQRPALSVSVLLVVFFYAALPGVLAKTRSSA